MCSIFEKKRIILVKTLALIFLLSPFIVSAAQLFNVEIDLPNSYQNVNPGTDVWFTIKLLNLANSQRVDVTLNYDILNSNGESIIHNSKTVAVETQASFVADLKIPETALPGDYSINVVVSSSLGESTAKAVLRVSTPQNDLVPYYIGSGIVGLILLILLVVKSKPLVEKLKLKMKIGRIVKEKLKKK
jgi:uncharacterized membrane protein